MTTPNLHPLNGCVLVKLDDTSQVVATLDGKYDTKTSGLALELNYITDSQDWLVGKRVYWNAYKDDSKVTVDGVEYAFIKLKDLTGYATITEAD